MRRFRRGMHPIRKLAAPATDRARLAPELAAGIARGKSAESIVRQVRQAAHTPPRPGAPKRAGHHGHQGLCDRAIIGVPFGCVRPGEFGGTISGFIG